MPPAAMDGGRRKLSKAAEGDFRSRQPNLGQPATGLAARVENAARPGGARKADMGDGKIVLVGGGEKNFSPTEIPVGCEVA